MSNLREKVLDAIQKVYDETYNLGQAADEINALYLAAIPEKKPLATSMMSYTEGCVNAGFNDAIDQMKTYMEENND